MPGLFRRELVHDRTGITRLWLLLCVAALALIGAARCQAGDQVSDKLANERGGQLVALARKYFTNLSLADLRLLEAVPAGEMVWLGDKSADPARIAEDDQHRIDARLVRWLLTDPDAGKLADPSGITIGGAWIKGELNLESETITLPLKLERCRIADGIDLSSATTATIDLQYSFVPWIYGIGLIVERDLRLSRGSYGQVILDNARIGSDLDADYAKFGLAFNPEPDGSFALIDLKNAEIGGGVY